MAWLESASIDCARVIRGMASIANEVTPAWASPFATSPLVSGWRNPIRTVPSFIRPISSADGGATLATTSPEKPSPRPAPASSYSPSGTCADSPAPDSSTTSTSCDDSFLATSGTRATLRSPSAVSFGTESFI